MSGVRTTLGGVIGGTAVFFSVAYSSTALFIGPVDCNPMGEATAYDPETDACYRFRAACKGAAQDVECAGAIVPTNDSFAEVVSLCGNHFCVGFSQDNADGSPLVSTKASCKWTDASVKVSLKRDDKLCKPCCLKPNKVTGCDGVCNG